MLLVVAAAACTTVGEDDLQARYEASLGIERPRDPHGEAGSGVEPAEPPSTSSPTAEAAEPDGEPTVATIDLGGLIAVGGLDDLVIVDPAGVRVATSPPENGGIGQQPAWSRDGERAVGFLPHPGGGSVTVVSDTEAWVADARRGYFFFSWSGDGRYIAALGPGPAGTTLDILTADAQLATNGSIDTGSFYLAWEPGGDDLVVHLDDDLALVRDPLDLETLEPLGSPGQSFLAPAWIPGTRDVLIVDESSGSGRLVRLDVDTGESADLGAVQGSIGIAVSPDGTRAVLAHAVAAGGGDITVGLVQADVSAPTEVIDLATGERTPISDRISIWTEWSPDGSKLALMQANRTGDGAMWAIWDGAETTSVVSFQPTLTFFRNYVFFSWQFTESPRVWSPGSDAVVYGANVDGTPGIWIVRTDGTEPVRVSDGTVAFWSSK